MQATRSKISKKPTVQSYHKVSLIFVAASLLLLIFVLYLSVSKAIIDIVPKERVVSVEIPARVTVEVDEENEMPGFVFEKSLTRARTFTLPQDDAQPVEAKATGTVTLINDGATPQQLIPTTRLLSEEGVLFRLDSAVTVPAGGQVDAQVSADQSGRGGEVGPTQFTIPGLNETRQKEVYAVSVDPMAGGVRYVRPLRQADIDGAAEELKKQLVEEAKAEWITSDMEAFDAFYSEVELANIKTDIPLETETGVFTLTADITIRAVAYAQISLTQLAEARLLTTIDQGERLSRVIYEAAAISIKSIDTNRGEAELVIVLDGASVIDATHPTLQPDQFVNQAGGEVESILRTNELIESVEVRFIPAWLKRMPTLPDHIEVRIKERE